MAEKAAEWGVDSYRGSVDDLLDRYYRAARLYEADPVVRLTADCPLIDPKVVDRVIEKFLELGDHDLVGTDGTFPDGLDTSVFAFRALGRAWKEARLPSEREHVGPYITSHPEIFKTSSITCFKDLGRMRWTVDEERDLLFVKEVMKRLYREGEMFYMEDVLELLEKEPRLMEINKGIIRNEGLLKSLKENEEFIKRSKGDVQ
jgi:spore coat polysaccharide biosynthesis protein SpsF